MALISPRDLYLRQHPELAKYVASGDKDRLHQFLVNHQNIWIGWQRVSAATAATLQDPYSPTTTAGSTAGTTQTTSTPTSPYDSLSQGQRDWFDELTSLFRQNGLEALANTVIGFAQQGITGAAFDLQLQQSDAYRTRFAANEARKKAGLPVLSPAEYLATERQYRQVMQTAGLPAGFYDDPSDFTNFLSNDTSVAEINDRVQSAVTLAKRTDAGYRSMLANEFGIGLTDGDIAAYLLDEKRALPVLQRQVQSVGIADAARRQGLDYSATRAQVLAELGITGEQAQSAYGQIAQATGAYGKASAAFGGDYTQTDAEDELLLGSSAARAEREQLDNTFKAYNPGSTSRKSTKALSDDTTGSY